MDLAVVQLVMLVGDQVKRALLVTGKRQFQKAALQVNDGKQNRIGLRMEQDTVRQTSAEVEMQHKAGRQFVLVFGELQERGEAVEFGTENASCFGRHARTVLAGVLNFRLVTVLIFLSFFGYVEIGGVRRLADVRRMMMNGRKR